MKSSSNVIFKSKKVGKKKISNLNKFKKFM